MKITTFLGWVGTVLIVGAYFLNSFNYVESASLSYQGANILGAAFLAINVFAQKAWPAFGLQCVWMAIGIAAIARIFQL